MDTVALFHCLQPYVPSTTLRQLSPDDKSYSEATNTDYCLFRYAVSTEFHAGIRPEFDS
jgi:hypothetical protein